MLCTRFRTLWPSNWRCNCTLWARRAKWPLASIATNSRLLAGHVLHQLSAAPNEARALPDARLLKAVELMHAKLAAPLTLDDLAAAATLSPFHFAKAFKAAYGSAPHQYLTQLRIEKAQALLKQTALPIAAIVEAAGYSNASHFTAAFRKATGVTPAAYRKG